jgi:hypothetical protein
LPLSGNYLLQRVLHAFQPLELLNALHDRGLIHTKPNVAKSSPQEGCGDAGLSEDYQQNDSTKESYEEGDEFACRPRSTQITSWHDGHGKWGGGTSKPRSLEARAK